MLLEPDDHTCARGGWNRGREKEERKGEAVMRRKSGGGTREGGREEVSHEFTAWLNTVNYWLARSLHETD